MHTLSIFQTFIDTVEISKIKVAAQNQCIPEQGRNFFYHKKMNEKKKKAKGKNLESYSD